MIDHDRLFKELIQTFFEEFILLFFPQAFEEIDFQHLTFLSEEVFTDITAGEKRRVDLLVETKLKGEEGLVIVHIEPQSYVQPAFPERMFIYFSRLYEKYRRRILPIAVFSYETTRDEPSEFNLGFSFLDVLRFQFFTVELQKQNWREYVKQDNPIAAALLSKMGYTKEERVQVKKEFLRMVIRMQLDPARQKLIAGFFDTYLAWTELEEQELQKELKKLDSAEEARVMELKTFWEKQAEMKGRMEGILEGKQLGILEGKQKGKQEGKQEGRQEGKLEAKWEIAINLLSMGIDPEVVMKSTGLSKDEIEKLRSKLH
ncbi:Rpn family recombination-promoting nuclease/putative transposase [Fodinisporobacter ferrooxydans]|uniref:Rpn family recombination-promoting nuclease/putative transposase n=1 Tax=Fodinisporobacter ferrooxydans TaxID=2901836 RepID=A0ABY4CPG1_9BACL|nr:Rpn family recombination-promoting nuclease/putative transposase [Alicyclobacillaceae bacterium MYW30-H2]